MHVEIIGNIYEDKQLLNNKKEIIVKELKIKLSRYIVLTQDKKEIRFFITGIFDVNKMFTGVMHDYTGSGNYEETLVVKDKWIPTVEDGEPLEWDYQVELFDSIAETTLEEIENSNGEFMYLDTDIFNYVLEEDTLPWYNDGVLIDNCSKVIPFGLGNTTFADGYEITETLNEEEIIEMVIDKFSADLNNADVIRINNSPLLEKWKGDFDLISTSWKDEGLTYEIGMDRNSIEYITHSKGKYIIVTEDNPDNEINVFLYKLESI